MFTASPQQSWTLRSSFRIRGPEPSYENQWLKEKGTLNFKSMVTILSPKKLHVNIYYLWEINDLDLDNNKPRK